MKRRLAPLAILCWAVSAYAAPPAGFEARVEALRKEIGVPGMAVSIVENGRITLARGFGVRVLGSDARVDADTIFQTGSTGKAFTVADLAILVDQGRLGWDDKVIDRLPGFQMYDPWVTREMTVRDLLVHRSGLGLGEGDLLFVPRTNLTRAESVRRLRYLKPATSFRSGFAYDNVLYMVVGQLIEAVTGQTWEQFTVDNVLKPAGMLHSVSESQVRLATENRAHPHARTDGAIRGLGSQAPLDEHDELGRTAAPAGGLAISANDMARWLLIQLGDGKLPEGSGRLFSEEAHRQMWTPVVVQPIEPVTDALKATQPQFNAYALGWEVRDYRGAKVVWHHGSVLGSTAVVVLIPDKQTGFSIEINSEDGEIIDGLMFELLDYYIGGAARTRPAPDWPRVFMAATRQDLAQALQVLQTVEAHPANVGPSLPLARYAGTYTDSWYGDIVVSEVNGALSINFKSTPHMAGRLEHWQYESFIARFDDKSIEPAYVTFILDDAGKVTRVTLKPASPLANFSYDYRDLDFKPAEPVQ
jgi:CubicO group peptidase (beta-lactamase class C family)